MNRVAADQVISEYTFLSFQLLPITMFRILSLSPANIVFTYPPDP